MYEEQIDYLIVGDSYVQGHCVKNDNNYRGLLEKSSNKMFYL